jgi:exopolysaccharide biosynthesis WecB/TagA/CpsF family protein
MEFNFKDQRISLDTGSQTAVLDKVATRFRKGQGFAMATINLDHLVKLTGSPVFRKAYAHHEIVVADGRPIVTLSKMAGRTVDLMPGSDLILPLCRVAASENVPVALVGSTDVALADAATALKQDVPGLNIALCVAPSGAFDPNGDEAGTILDQLVQAGIGLCFLALGAPKQEIFAQRGRGMAPRVGFVSIGAGLDFLGGHQRRAPLVMRRSGLEWLWRALSSPLRLGPRYVKCLLILPGQIVQALRLRDKGE